MLKRILSFFKPLPGSPRANRLALADHLEKNVTDAQYNHRYYTHEDGTPSCALGHAAGAKIAGFFLSGEFVLHPSSNLTTDIADKMFGEGAWDKIFSTFTHIHDGTRNSVITALRSYS